MDGHGTQGIGTYRYGKYWYLPVPTGMPGTGSAQILLQFSAFDVGGGVITLSTFQLNLRPGNVLGDCPSSLHSLPVMLTKLATMAPIAVPGGTGKVFQDQ